MRSAEDRCLGEIAAKIVDNELQINEMNEE